MSEPVRILIVEDVSSDFDLAQREIRKVVNDCVFQQVQTKSDFLHALNAFQPDLILSDYQMPSFDGLTALKLAQEHAKLTPFIIWTGTMGEDVAVECMKAGAVNYILKENIKRLGSSVAHALEERRLLLEHQRAAELIQNNEKRFRALIENGLDNISLLSADGTLLWESPATVRTLGYEPDEFLGHNIFQLMHPEDLNWASERFAKLLQEPGAREQGIFRLRHHDGTWRWTEAVVTNLLHEPGVEAIVINYRDITERKQAEEMLKEERNLLRTLIDHLPDRIFVMDAQGRKTLSNTADWKASGGGKMEDVLGKTDFDTYPAEMAEGFWALDKAVIDSGKPVINYEEPGLDAAGNLVWVLSTKVPLHDGQGKIAGLVGIGRDITERKQADVERQTLLEIMQGLADTDDLQHFLRLIHRSIARMIYAENFFVVLYNENTALFEEIYSVDQYDEPASPSALEKSITSYVFRTGEPLLLTKPLFEDLVAQGEVELVGTDSVSWLGAPLKIQNRTIGVIVVQDYENPNSYTERDRDFLSLIGSQIALAIERKQSADRQKYHARLLRHINDAVIATDDQFRITAWNRAAEKMYGWSSKEVLGRNVSEVLSADLNDEQRAENRELLKQSNVSREERIYQRRDGRTIFVEANTIALTDEQGKFTGYVSVNRDITERKKVEIDLRQSEEQYRSLFEDSPISLWVEDFSEVKQRLDQLKKNGIVDIPTYLREHPEFVVECAKHVRILDVNTAAMKLYHASQKSELLGSLDNILSTFPIEQFEQELIQLANDRSDFEREEIDQTLTGEEIHVNMRWSVAPGYEDSLEKVIISTLDVTERKRAEERIQLQIQHLRALRAIDIAISSSFNLSLTLDVLLEQVITQLKVDAAGVLLFQPITKTLVYAASRGFSSTAIREAKIRLGEGYAGNAILEGRMIHIPNLMETNTGSAQALLMKGENLIDYYGLPLIVKGEMKGVLEIFHRSVLDSNPDWLDFLDALAGQALIAIENATLFENLQRSNSELFQAYDATIEGWSHALDLRDKETEGHTLRVTELTMELARQFGFTEEQLINIRWGALLHDIGKMGVPDTILLKPGTLTDEEWEIMRRHPTFAFEMLSPIGFLRSSLDIPYCHHEKWDGSGYPRGLKGEVIPLAARLFAVVDVWDALRSDRPYRKGWTVEATIEHIRSQTGTHFDPKVVEPFLNLIGWSTG
jgi:PAS domain S-box-containing protein/putative nucleotidyltransferase with HDIG domain